MDKYFTPNQTEHAKHGKPEFVTLWPNIGGCLWFCAPWVLEILAIV